MKFVVAVAIAFVLYCTGCRTIQLKCHELCDAIKTVTEE